MLLQLNPDSSFCTLLGITTIQDSTQLQKTRGSNFFTKTSDFTGSDFFFAFDSEKMVLKNDFVNGNYVSKQHSSSVCYMYSHTTYTTSNSGNSEAGAQVNVDPVRIEVRVFVEVACGIGNSSYPNWFGQISTNPGTAPGFSFAGGGYNGGSSSPGDPFEPLTPEQILNSLSPQLKKIVNPACLTGDNALSLIQWKRLDDVFLQGINNSPYLKKMYDKFVVDGKIFDFEIDPNMNNFAKYVPAFTGGAIIFRDDIFYR